MRKVTKTKYSAFINDCYHHVTFDKNLMRDTHEVSNNLLRAMTNKQIIRLDAGTGTWIGATPNQIMMNEVFKEYKRLVDLDVKMFIILAVGTLIGFLIATLIWK